MTSKIGDTSLASILNFNTPTVSPDTSPAPSNCPEKWTEYENSCYTYGDHKNFDAASYECQKHGAELVKITDRNARFLLGYIRTESTAGDHFIKSGNVDGKRAQQPSDLKCPLIKGALVKPTFATVSCNSAYPYICQKDLKNLGGLPNLGNLNSNTLLSILQALGVQNKPTKLEPDEYFPKPTFKSLDDISGFAVSDMPRYVPTTIASISDLDFNGKSKSGNSLSILAVTCSTMIFTFCVILYCLKKCGKQRIKKFKNQVFKSKNPSKREILKAQSSIQSQNTLGNENFPMQNVIPAREIPPPVPKRNCSSYQFKNSTEVNEIYSNTRNDSQLNKASLNCEKIPSNTNYEHLRDARNRYYSYKAETLPAQIKILAQNQKSSTLHIPRTRTESFSRKESHHSGNQPTFVHTLPRNSYMNFEDIPAQNSFHCRPPILNEEIVLDSNGVDIRKDESMTLDRKMIKSYRL